jgi:hypothetical protein
MATMIPDSVEQFTTDGERQTYQFLKTVAKPDARYLCWYLPDVQGREPDFILYSQQNGLIILEVKDWNLNQIREVNPHHFVLDIGGKTVERKNPLKQARDYLNGVLDKIKGDGRLVSRNPIHHGNPKLPIDCGVVFPNINKFEYREKGLGQVIGTEKGFFWDDLHPASDICSDPSGACFARALEERFPPRFTFMLSGPEMDHLKQLIFPAVRVEIPERDSELPYKKRICRLRGLDHHQEALARKFENGHRIIIGPSGCGKTLILVHKADCLFRYNSKIKSILFICYNITLANYIRRLLAEKEVPFGRNGVQVKHFYELCSEIVGEPVEYENEDSDYYEMVAQEALEKAEASNLRFDAVLVDEGQDFSDTMFKVTSTLLNPATDNLTIALDDGQNIYRRRSSWKEVGIKARGRIHKIDYVYRNTVEISRFAARFAGQPEKTGDSESLQMPLFPNYFDFHGPEPELKQLKNLDAVVAFTADKIEQVVKAERCPYSEIAVIYTLKRPDPDRESLPILLENTLASRGILSRWAAENYRSKRTYDITTNSVTISTIHSVKGLDFSCVFLIGLDYLELKDWTEEQVKNLVYVGITRARYQLYIPFINKTPLINRLQRYIN